MMRYVKLSCRQNKHTNPPNPSSGFSGQALYQGNCPWRMLIAIWKAPASPTERCWREIPACCNTLLLSPVFRNPIHFPTHSSESVHLCTFPQSSHLALTLASSLLPQHSAAILIITCITRCLGCQLFLRVFVTPASHQGDREHLEGRGHDSLIFSPPSPQTV